MRYSEIDENKDPNRPIDLLSKILVGSHNSIYEYYKSELHKIQNEKNLNKRNKIIHDTKENLNLLLSHELISTRIHRLWATRLNKK